MLFTIHYSLFTVQRLRKTETIFVTTITTVQSARKIINGNPNFGGKARQTRIELTTDTSNLTANRIMEMQNLAISLSEAPVLYNPVSMSQK